MDISEYPPLPDEDQWVFQSLSNSDFASLRGQNVLLTGGSGFVGSWILEALLWLNDVHDLQVKIYVLTRDPRAWEQQRPHLASGKGVAAIRGNILEPAFWRNALPARLDVLIHAAFDSGKRPGTISPRATLDTLIDGTRKLLQECICRNVHRVLYVSSGAVYGSRFAQGSLISENCEFGPDPLSPQAAYAEGKRAAEAYVAAMCQDSGAEHVIARLFAFVGPYLPLDQHFAIGNFLRDVLRKKEIRLSSSGESVRSYLYAADMAVWCLKILFNGISGTAYNVGSDHAITILELARMVAALGNMSDKISVGANDAASASRYVPDVALAQNTLGLRVTVPLENAIRRTLHYYSTLIES